MLESMIMFHAVINSLVSRCIRPVSVLDYR